VVFINTTISMMTIANFWWKKNKNKTTTNKKQFYDHRICFRL